MAMEKFKCRAKDLEPGMIVEGRVIRCLSVEKREGEPTMVHIRLSDGFNITTKVTRVFVVQKPSEPADSDERKTLVALRELADRFEKCGTFMSRDYVISVVQEKAREVENGEKTCPAKP